MRFRVLTQSKVLFDEKAPKERREKFNAEMATLEQQEEWLEPNSMAIGGSRISGMPRSIKRVKENGEEIVVFEFWEV